MLAYNVLRRDPDFLDEKERERLNLAHAEFGLVVIMAEGCFVAAAYAFSHPSSHPAWWVWSSLGVFLWFASYPAPLYQHAAECLRWRVREETDKDKETGLGAVSTILKKYGLL